MYLLIVTYQGCELMRHIDFTYLGTTIILYIGMGPWLSIFISKIMETLSYTEQQIIKKEG